jgi:predicted metal-dependent RNase
LYVGLQPKLQEANWEYNKTIGIQLVGCNSICCELKLTYVVAGYVCISAIHSLFVHTCRHNIF